MKKSDRFIALALCCTLTLGAFAYRPPEAKAIAGVDDAVVIGALLSAFAGGCGLIFTNNGMTSNEIAQGLTDKWNEFNEAAESGASSFAAWLGFEDTSALLGALSFSGSKLVIPRAIARKFAEFTTWLKNRYGVSPDGGVSLTDSIFLSDLVLSPSTYWNSELCNYFNASLGACSLSLSSNNSIVDDKVVVGMLRSQDCVISSPGDYTFNFSYTTAYSLKSGASISSSVGISQVYLYCYDASGRKIFTRDLGVYPSVFSGTFTAYIPANSTFYFTINFKSNCAVASQHFSWSGFLTPAKGLSFRYDSSAQIPDIADDDTAPSPTITGVGDGTATTIEGLLQQILAQLQANTLAPTLDLAGTESGGNTGTDEDTKPYLPYIPQIFEKIKDLPGTLANIWESIKGIPAAIAEKIGAFFTTLWGWLQSIIDAITALPAAIAEKIGALFKPDEALLTEITDTFKGKFGFFSTLKQFGSDLFGMTPESEPPVIWVHLENAESKFGYNYGDKQKIFDMTWYQKYKASVDGLPSGFLWLGYLWLLFKRAPAILGGMQLSADDAPRSVDMPDVLSSPRLGAGDGSTMYRGDGFTMRDKGGRSK